MKTVHVLLVEKGTMGSVYCVPGVDFDVVIMIIS